MEPTYGVVLLHGFTGSPFEMQLLGADLTRAFPQLKVVIPSLPGHAEDAHRLGETNWADWSKLLEETFHALKQTCTHVSVVGLSMGGLLTLELASRRSADIASIVSLSAPMWLSPFLSRGIRFMQRTRFGKVNLPAIGSSDIADPIMRIKNDAVKTHRRFPLTALVSLLDLMDHLPDKLSRVTAPILLMHARRDHTAPFASMDFIAGRVSSAHMKKIALERSFHVITLDVERDAVFEAVRAHLSAHLFSLSPRESA